jgi:prephenate dehydrogenase
MENPGVLEVHDAFIRECEELSGLVRAHDEEGFVKKMKAAALQYGDTAHALRKSDKLINSRISEYQTILNSVGKVCGFSHFYSGKIHVGALVKVGPDEIVLTKLVSKGTSLHIKNKFVKLKLENLRLLSESELREWRKENLEHSTRDISLLIPDGADPAVILNAINTNKNLVACEISDIYKGNNRTDYEGCNRVETEKGRKEVERLGVTYRITVFGDCDADSVEADVTALLCGLGCRIREKNLKPKR